MESNNELKEIDIKNCTCCYFDDVMIVGDFDFNNILLDKKLYENTYENILMYVISYKTVYSGVRYLISDKSGVTYSINHNFARVKIDSYNSLPKKKTVTFHNIMILIKLFLIRIKVTITIIYF